YPVPRPDVQSFPTRRASDLVHADQAFLRKGPYKKILDYLHYRILDVSSIKEAARRWCPDIAARVPPKKGLHQAKQDIIESIEEADRKSTRLNSSHVKISYAV